MISVNRLMSLHKNVLSLIEKVIFHDEFNIHNIQNIHFMIVTVQIQSMQNIELHN